MDLRDLRYTRIGVAEVKVLLTTVDESCSIVAGRTDAVRDQPVRQSHVQQRGGSRAIESGSSLVSPAAHPQSPTALRILDRLT
jgi:hypothetical protein